MAPTQINKGNPLRAAKEEPTPRFTAERATPGKHAPVNLDQLEA